MNRIDAETAAKIRTVIELCRMRGADTVHTLDQAGMLRHESTIRADRVQLLTAMIESWRATPADRMSKLPGLPRTALDLKNYMIRALEDMRDKVIKDGNAAQQ